MRVVQNAVEGELKRHNCGYNGGQEMLVMPLSVHLRSLVE